MECCRDSLLPLLWSLGKQDSPKLRSEGSKQRLLSKKPPPSYIQVPTHKVNYLLCWSRPTLLTQRGGVPISSLDPEGFAFGRRPSVQGWGWGVASVSSCANEEAKSSSAQRSLEFFVRRPLAGELQSSSRQPQGYLKHPAPAAPEALPSTQGQARFHDIFDIRGHIHTGVESWPKRPILPSDWSVCAHLGGGGRLW